MYLIVGLGNPGIRYRKTRHNLGFMAVDFLCQSHGSRFKRGEGPWKEAFLTLGETETLLVKPLTYMNRSGEAVKPLVDVYDVPLSRVLILCDDLNLPLGKLRLRARGSDGGQRGLASVSNRLSSRDFPRLRMGIGMNPHEDAARYVLSRFRREEKMEVKSMIQRAASAVTCFVENGVEKTMSQFNQ